ncbi:MAG TPA: PAS domain S-box protein, partial [Geobacteraceae bacterium]
EFMTEESRRLVEEATLPAFFRNGALRNVPLQMRKKSGEVLDLLLSATAERDDAGEVTRSLAVLLDITEHRRAENALAESEKKFRVIVETTKEWIWTVNADMRHTYSNPAIQEILGYSPEEVVEQVGQQFLHPDDVAEAERVLATAVAQKKGWDGVVLRWRHRDGTYRYLESKATPLLSEAGVLLGFQGVDRDITRRVLAEEAHRKSEELLGQLIERSPVAICIMDHNQKIEYLNRKFTDTFGFTLEDIPDVPSWWPRAYPDETYRQEVMERWNAAVAQAIAGETELKPMEARVTCKDGSIRFVEGFGAAVGERFLVILNDISDRKEWEEALQESERKFRSLYEAMNEGVALHELLVDGSGKAEDYRIVDVNPAFETITGFTRDQAVGRKASELYDTGDPPFLETYAPIALAGGHHEFETYFPPMAKHFRISVFSPCRGQFATVFTDITRRKAAEEAHRRSEEQLRQLIRRFPMPVGICDDHGHIEYLNDRFPAHFGYSLADIPDTDTWWRRACPDEYYRREAARTWQEACDRARGEGRDIEPREYRVTCSDGMERVVMLFGTTVGDKRLVIFEDVTERKKAEEQIERLNTDLATRAAELEDANGELEAFTHTVSHDLRVPLTPISGYAHLLQDLYGDCLDERGKGFLREIIAATRRMGRLIDTLLKFSAAGHQEVKQVRVDLSAIVTEVAVDLQLAEPLRRVQVIIARRIRATGDPLLLRVMMTNLIGNAWKYTARTEQAVIEFGASEQHGRSVYFVRDNGAGFAMESADRLFIPFERLHAGGDYEGSGIGLATVRRIVQRHGGEIWAEGAVGTGATFYFTLGET